jgi:hypothetical protein
MTGESMLRSLPLLLALAITNLMSPEASLDAHGSHGPRLEITSPRSHFVTTARVIDVTVAFDARWLPADTIVLLVDGVEVDRITSDTPFEELTHTFTIDLSNHPDGIATLRARALRTEPVPGHRKHQTRRTKAVVLGSDVVRLRLDRDVSNGVLVGAAGGELTSADGALTLSIPEGALRRTREITMNEIDPASLPPLDEGATPTAAYELLPHGLRFTRPVSVALTLDGSSKRADGSVGRETVGLLNLSGDVIEELSDQTLTIDGNSGLAVAHGTISHFSTVIGAITNRYVLTISGIPEPAVVPLNAMFTVKVIVTPLPGAPIQGDVRIDRTSIGNLRLVDPPENTVERHYVGRQAVEVDFQFQCTEVGVGHEVLKVRVPDPPPADSTLVVDADLNVYCTDEATSEGKRSFMAYDRQINVTVDPVTQTRIVMDDDPRPAIKLLESINEPDVQLKVTITDLNPGVLSPPERSRSSHPATLVSRGPRSPVYDLDTSLGSGSAEQEIVWDCEHRGITTLLFQFTFSKGTAETSTTLFAAVECTEPNNDAPEIRSSPPQDPVVPGTPAGSYFYVPNVFGLRQTVWELLLEGPGGTWVSQLPEWVDFNSETGQVSGTPRADQAGTYRFRLTAREMDDSSRQAAQEFTITVTAPPPIPSTVIVPSFVGLIRDGAIDQILAVGLLLGNVIEIVDPLQPVETIVAQTPLAGAVAALGSAVDLVINVARAALTPVGQPEGLHNTRTFNLPPGNRITIAGSNGFVILDAITGEIPSAGTTELSFTNQGFGPFFGTLVLEDPLGSGGDTIFAYGEGTAMTMFDPIAN